jgi:hypothetical protein
VQSLCDLPPPVLQKYIDIESTLCGNIRV